MAAGLQVWNVNNEPIIDTSFPNYGLVRKVSIDSLPKGKPKITSNIQWWQDWKYLDVPNSFAPLLFFRGNTGVGIITVEVTGSSFRYFFDYFGDSNGQGTSTVQIYVFDLMSQVYPNGAAHHVGLESFDANGKLIFTTAMKPLKLVSTSKPNASAYSNIAGAYCAYGGYGNSGTGFNGAAQGGGWDDWWKVTSVPQTGDIAVGMTRFRYGASSSSTESNYGDALFESVSSDRVNGINLVSVGTAFTGLSGEGFGGIMGTTLDNTAGYEPLLLMIDVTGY